MAARMTALPREKSHQAPLSYPRPVPPGRAPCVPRSPYSTLFTSFLPQPRPAFRVLAGMTGRPAGSPHPSSLFPDMLEVKCHPRLGKKHPLGAASEQQNPPRQSQKKSL